VFLRKYQIEQRYIRLGNARSGEKLTGPLFIVSHETANNSADADDHFNYFNNSQPSASAHTFIDDGEILEIIPLDEKAWHNLYRNPEDIQLFGYDANEAAIAVELCRTGEMTRGPLPQVQFKAFNKNSRTQHT
jgi:N-acetylmuramoyl-L-alanine amidase